MKPTTISQVPENIPLGILWMLATMFMFVVLDTIAKYLTQFYPITQVVWARFFFHMLWLCLILGKSIIHLSRSGNLKLQIIRSLLMLATTFFFITGLSTTPLPTASSIMFLSPILVTVLAVPLLGETVGMRRFLGVLVGFTGALIIVRPESGGVAIGHLFMIAAALSNALYQITTRQVRLYDEPMTSLLYSGLAGSVLCTLVVPFQWQTPDISGWGLFLLLGLAGCLSHFCLIRAFRHAQASAVMPFSYSTLLWATIASYFIFDSLPDKWTLSGALLIIAGGMYIFYRERALAEAKITE